MDSSSSSDRHIQIQRDAIGSAIVSGDGNKVFIYQYQYHLPLSEAPTATPEHNPEKLAPNPYRGLLAFQETDGDRFFGREKQTQQLWQRLRDLYEDRTATRVLPVYGPSGSGKSSLARAGLIPELACHPLPGRQQARVAILVPGAHPLEALAGVLAAIATNDLTPVAKTREFAGELGQANRAGEYDGLRRIADLLPESATTPLIVLVDQFEEIYTLCADPAERDTFVSNLIWAAQDAARRVSIVVTLRSDFLGETQKHPVLNRLFSSQGFLVPAMSEEELGEAIRKPAERAGHPLDEATIRLLLEQAEGREGSLPLLQFALTRIWEGIGEGVAPAVTLERIGGVGGALAGEAQRVYDCLTPAEQMIARRVFLGLVQLGEGTRDTRRRAMMDNLTSYKDSGDQVRRVVERFSDPGVRLLVLGADERGQETAEVSHEALFDHWQLLDRWLEESRSDLRFQRRLEEAVQVWNQRGRPSGSLWRAPDLDLLRRYVQHSGGDLTPLQLQFFRASVRAERQGKLLRGTAASSLVILTSLALWQTWSAHRSEQRAFALQLAAQAELINTRSNGLYEKGALLAVEAKKRLDKFDKDSLEADRALRSALPLLPGSSNILKHEGWVSAVAFSPDGSRVVTGSSDKTARIWNTKTGEIIHPLPHEAWISAVAFSQDGSMVVTGSGDKTARIWNTKTGEIIHSLPHEAWISAVAFSKDNSMVVTGSDDNTACIWSVQTGELLHTLPHEDWVSTAIFSPDGSTVLTGSSDKTARIWNTKTGEIIQTLPHEGSVPAVAFSQDGSTVLTGSYDNTARIWDSKTGKLLRTLSHDGPVHSVAFSYDGFTALTGSSDKLARIWDIKTGKSIQALQHDGSVWSVAFSPDGSKVITGGLDRSAYIWPTEVKKEPQVLSHDGSVWSVAFSPDGSKVITGSGDKSARIWNIQTGKIVHILPHEDSVSTVAFSQDGSKVITGSGDKSARIWNVQTGKIVHILPHEDSVSTVAFSQDGSKVITGSGDKTARVWNTATGKILHSFLHENEVSTVVFSADGSKVVTGSGERVARIWDVKSGSVNYLLPHEGRVFSVAFSQDDSMIATGSDDKLATIWNAKTGEPLQSLRHKGQVSTVAFSQDSSMVATGSVDGLASIWNIATGKILHSLPHENGVSTIAFSPDGSKVFTKSGDDTARIWNVSKGTLIHILPHGGSVSSVAFSPDGSTVVTGSRDNTARIWTVSIDRFVDEICTKVTRNSSETEWRNYLNPDLRHYQLVCGNLPVHSSVLLAGREILNQGNKRKALAILRRAKSLQPDIDLDPTTPEKIDSDPKKAIKTIELALQIEKSESALRDGEVDKTIRLYQAAKKSIDIKAYQWNQLCWLGSLHRRAADVMFACEKALELSPHSTRFQRSRGVARALTGDKEGAIEDLQAYFTALDRESEKEAPEKQWIEQLQAGKDPFTDEVLQNLLYK